MDPNSTTFLIVGLAPELILIAVACTVLMIGMFDVSRRTACVPALALGGLVVALAVAVMSPPVGAAERFHVRVDELARTVRIITLAVGVLIVLVNVHLPGRDERGEFHAMVLFSLAGVMLVGVADDLLVLLFALELVSVPTYVLVAGSSADARAQEAGVKYFFLGALSVALTVYGLSFLYGATGTTVMTGGPDSVATERYLAAFARADGRAVIGLVLALAGITFKMAAVPFHLYAADVYQGAASPITGLLGFVPKLAGLIGLIKLLSLTGWSWDGTPMLFWVMWVLAAATMTVGNVLALLQTNAKRILAYSSVAHSGYLLVAVLAGPAVAGAGGGVFQSGLAAALFYITAYGVTNLGAFAVLAYLAHRGRPIETVDELAGLSRAHPGAALVLAICLFSLMGMPPTAGFFGKVGVFSAAISADDPALVALAIIGVINAAIGAAYYLRLIAACYLRSPTVALEGQSCPALRSAMGACAVAVLLLGLWPRYLMDLSQRATSGLQRADGAVIATIEAAPPETVGVEPRLARYAEPAERAAPNNR